MKTLLATFLLLIVGEVTGQETPPRLSAGEAFCIVEYTVTKTGTTTDIVLEDCGTEEDTKVFGKSAIKAAGKYIYKPKIVDGVPVETKGVRIRIEFRLDIDPEINNKNDNIKPSDTIQPPK